MVLLKATAVKFALWQSMALPLVVSHVGAVVGVVVGVVVGAVVGAVVVVGVVVGAAVGLCVLEVVQTQQSHPLQPTAPSHTPAFTPCLQQMPSVPQ